MRLLCLIGRELLESVRSQTALIVLLTPVLLALLLGRLNTQQDLKPLAVVLVAPQDSGLVRVLQQNPGLATQRSQTWEQAQQAIARDQAVLAIDIPADFDSQLLAGNRPSLHIATHRGRPTQVALAREFLRAALRQQAGQNQPARIELDTRPRAPQKSAADFWFASAVVLASMSALVVTASNVVEEKEAGILRQILLSPASSKEIWLGKLIASALLGTLAAMPVVVLHGTTLPGLWTTLGYLSVASLGFAALGGIVGLLAKGPAAASSWTGLCFIALFAPASFSETSQAMSRWAYASPAYYLYDGVQRTVLAQESIATQFTNFAVLTVFTVILTLVGSRLLERSR